MDGERSRSRSKTPFTQMEQLGRDFIENERYTEKSNVRSTRRTTTFRLKEGIQASTEAVSSEIDKTTRISTRSGKNVRKLYKTSDYSSEDGENEVSSTKTITQNEKNQLIEDAKAAANGTNEVSALNLYKKSGRYWDVYPKTDWTYSPHSKDRIELAPGVVAMPNMSRKTIHSVHSTDSSNEFAHKETNTEVFTYRNEAQYAEYMPRKLFNNNYDNEYKYKKASFIQSQWIKVKRLSVSIFTSIVTLLYLAFGLQTSLFAKLHTFTSRVMLLDTWLLWKNEPGNKGAKLAALCLVPLILLGGCCIFTNLGSILYDAYFNSAPDISPAMKKIADDIEVSIHSPNDERSKLEHVQSAAERKLLEETEGTYMAPVSAAVTKSPTEKYEIEEIVEHLVQNRNFQSIIHNKFQDIDTFKTDDKDLVKHQQIIIETLQAEVRELKKHMTEIEKSKEDFSVIISRQQSEIIHRNVRLRHDINRCCRKPIINIENYVKRILSDLLNDPNFLKDQKGVTDYLSTIYVAKRDLETQLLNLTSNLNSKYSSLIEDNSIGLMDTISEKLKMEINKKLGNIETNTHFHKTGSDVSTLSEEHVKKIVKNVLTIYDADKTGLVDYAMETMGGQILTTRCTENYHYGKAVVSVLGIPLWYPVNSPRTIITPSINPGECWAFQNFPGFAVIRLSKRIEIQAFSLEHITKLLVPNGDIDSAPKQFEVFGLTDANDKDPLKLGEYVYDYNGEPLQYFDVQSEGNVFEIIELRILSNHGNPNYTCLYRFRVHGKSIS